MNEERKNSQQSPRVDETKEKLKDFLCGEAQELPQGVDRLEHLPMLLETLYRSAESPAEDCEKTTLCLEEYIRLGVEASGRMPDVHAHLNSCDFCQNVLRVLQEVAREKVKEDKPWESLADHDQQENRLMFAGDGYYLLSEGHYRKLEPEDLDSHMQIGEWFLDSPSVLELQSVSSFGDEAWSPKRPLCLHLPGKVGSVQVQVLTQYDTVKQVETWRFTCKLDASSQIRLLSIGLGGPQDVTTGRLDVQRGKSVEFSLLEPPSEGRDYYIYFEWQGPDDRQWHEHKVVFPVRKK